MKKVAGGSCLGDKYGNAYWGGYPDQDEVEKYIKEKGRIYFKTYQDLIKFLYQKIIQILRRLVRNFMNWEVLKG